MLLVQRASDRMEFGRGGFQIRRVLPGLCLQNPNDPMLNSAALNSSQLKVPSLLISANCSSAARMSGALALKPEFPQCLSAK